MGAAGGPTLTLRFPNGGQFVPEGDVVDIGRTDPSADWRPALDVLPFGGAGRQMGVSRHHARLIRRNGAFLLIDVGSRNGTYLNGRPLEANKPVELNDGDVVAFGAFNATVAVQPLAEAPAER